jgi:hypothetical protein
MAEGHGKRDRSPAFPQVPLGEAVERLTAFEKYFGRHPVSLDRAGLAWGLKQFGDILASLRYFGFIEYVGSSDARQVVITEDGRNLLRAQQESVKREILKRAALRPREIAKFWSMWGDDRPPDPVCYDELVLRNGFSERGAPLFLRSYDATISYAGLAQGAKIEADSEERIVEPASPEREDEDPAPRGGLSFLRGLRDSPAKGGQLMPGERELTTGLLSKDSSFRLIVSGPIGVKEIEMLIKKLGIDKEILADDDDQGEPPPNRFSYSQHEITDEQRQRLRDLGYAREEIDAMKSTEAARLIRAVDNE